MPMFEINEFGWVFMLDSNPLRINWSKVTFT